ncbi:1-(5-phosphoribosyl)-5-((5-phosphoribosylamino)methylideneamino) imidazole-4-carboxamide isomerase [Penicillium brasilianum]|uniref:1-(5-phosphoribosyl)-5-((5-phosphoribosylamino)methylideneamino) imidazole-4-carboxamide isomerase n=1 Tax=Penicillium brasilianum TaxID=104259 RepID=A0A1S9RA79_PENBI|nr:1-(5-phosphoribosyl)-5-((5-phosphoribosylamino)methylideneamino) imidazole-4-carboxamide isomerase [Penicillium brasilianum]
MTQFRPCIDLHSGQVKQIVGGTLSNVAEDLKTNYVSKLPASHYAELYQKHNLRGGHVVKLGPGNEEAALEAVRAWPNGLQVAGGITDKNAQYWIDQGAEKVKSIALLEPYCSEFLIHAADVEGLQQGVDEELVSKLAEWCTIPITYAGGARSLQDLEKVHISSKGKVDLTIGSALDIFGGSGVTFDECVEWNKTH